MGMAVDIFFSLSDKWAWRRTYSVATRKREEEEKDEKRRDVKPVFHSKLVESVS